MWKAGRSIWASRRFRSKSSSSWMSMSAACRKWPHKSRNCGKRPDWTARLIKVDPARKPRAQAFFTSGLQAALLQGGQPDFPRMSQHAEAVRQPYDHCNHDDDVENTLNLPVHRDVCVDEPEQHADDDQS